MKKPSCLYSRKKGMTFVEVIVVIAVIVIIVLLILPATRKAKVFGLGPSCLNNQHQQAMAFFIYAGDNKNYLPVNSPQARYCWDIETTMADDLLNNGVEIFSFYDPETEPTFTHKDDLLLWIYYANPQTNAAFGQSGFRRTGYAQTIYGTADYGFDDKLHATGPTATNANQKLTSTNDPAKKVQLACATLTSSPGSSEPSDNYAKFNAYTWKVSQTDYNFEGKFKPFISAHMERGKPTGGNEAMLDGHVQWVPFSNMVHRTIGDVIFYY
jgi:prepilin-type N-terminal cleavage/methylation domain-containing protein